MKKVESIYIYYFNNIEVFKHLPFERRCEIIEEMDKIYDGESKLSIAFAVFLNTGGISKIFTDQEIMCMLEIKTFRNFTVTIVKAIKDESLRAETAARVKFAVERLSILQSIKDKKILEYFLMNYALQNERMWILNSFSEEEKLNYMLNRLERERVSRYFDIEALNDIEALSLPESVALVLNRIEEFRIPIPEDPLMILMSKIKFAKPFFDFFLKRELYINNRLTKHMYNTFKDADILATLAKCTQPCARRSLIAALKDDSKKREYLDEFPKERNLFELSVFVQDVDLKMELIDKLSSESYRLTIASTAKTDEELKKMYKLFSNYYSRLSIAKRFKSDEIKMEIIKSGDFDESGKGDILLSIQDKSIRKRASYYCSHIEDDDTMDSDVVREYDIFDAGRDKLPRNLRFGVEIEVHGRKIPAIVARTESLLKRYRVQIERDGAEFTSDILSWRKKDLNTIYHVSDFATQNGLYSNQFCGGHIHYSSTFLKSWAAWFWLFYLLCKTERILFLISNRPDTLPREEIITYAQPISPLYRELLPSIMETKTPREFIEMIQENTGYKCQGINLDNIYNRFNTIEIRIPNGDIDPDIIAENVLLFGNLIVLAQKLSMLPMSKDVYDLLKILDSAGVREEQKLDVILKLLFKEEKNREIFRNRYYANIDKYYDHNGIDLELKFSDFDLNTAGISL